MALDTVVTAFTKATKLSAAPLREQRTFREWFDGATMGLSYITKRLNVVGGNVTIDATPLISAAPSAIAVWFAVFMQMRGVFQAAGFAYADVLAGLVGFVVAMVVEGIGFAGVNARDRVRRHNRSVTNPAERVDERPSQLAVWLYFGATFGILLGFEAIPSIVKWRAGAMTAADMVFHCTFAVFPVFSYIGANIFSTTDALEHATSQRGHNLEERIQALEHANRALESERDEARKSQKETANFAANLQEQLNSANTKLQVALAKLEAASDQADTFKTIATTGVLQVDNRQKKAKLAAADRRKSVLQACIRVARASDFNRVQVGGQLGVSHETIRNDISWLAEQKLLDDKQWKLTEAGQKWLDGE